jgi:hypothetical protein
MNLGTLIVSLNADVTGLKKAEVELNLMEKAIAKVAGLILTAFAVEKIIRFTSESMKLAASMEGVHTAFDKLGDSSRVFSELQTATRGAIDNFKLMQLTVKATDAQISTSDLVTYLTFASARAIQLGKSVDDFSTLIVNGAIRKFTRSMAPMALVMKDVKEAFRTDTFAKYITEQTKSMGDVVDTMSIKLSKYTTSVTNLKITWGNYLIQSPFVSRQIEGLTGMVNRLADTHMSWFQKLAQLFFPMNPTAFKTWKDQIQEVGDSITKLNTTFMNKNFPGSLDFLNIKFKKNPDIPKEIETLTSLRQKLIDEQGDLAKTNESDKESINLHNTTIKALQLRIDAMTGVNKVLDESVKKQEELGNIWKNFEGELSAINTIYSVFGDEAELHKKTLDEYTRTYEDLIRKGTNPLNEDMLNLIDNIRTLQDVVNADEAMKKMKEDLKDLNKIVLVASRSYQWKINAPEGYSGATSGMGLRPIKGAKIPKFVETEDIDTIGKLTNGLIHQREVVNGLSNSFRELFTSLNIGFTHATSIFQKLVNTMLQGVERIASEVIAKKIIDALFPATKLAMTTALTASQTAAVIAHTTATTASIPVIQAASIAADDLAYSEAAAAGAWVPFPGNLAAIAAGVAAVTSALASSKIATVVTKLARGGEVPPGYPNDTFPALLSSGEKVLPAGVGGLSMQPAGVGGKVLIEFKNGSLEGYLDYNQRKLNSYR